MPHFICLIVCLLFCSCIKHERTFASTLNTNMSIGEKIAFYANSFIDTPYDRVPIGLYVQNKKIIVDNEVDCMYLVFRATELAFADGDNKKAIQIGLDKRFHTHGLLDNNGHVVNYQDRFEYSEDMIASGKWGDSVFSRNEMTQMPGSRMYKTFFYLPKDVLLKKQEFLSRIQKGDIIFLVKDPKKRSKTQEIIAHLGIADVVNNDVYLIHASGWKGLNKPQGRVKKVLLKDYLLEMSKFVGVYITRF